MAGFGYRVLGFGGGSSGPAYIEATGGNETVTDGDHKIHIFTGDGNLGVTSKGSASGSNAADYLVVAGGGGGAQGTGGGGGGGGVTGAPSSQRDITASSSRYFLLEFVPAAAAT